MKKAIITGSEGFIGKFLCARLNGLFDVIRIDTKTGGDAVRIEPLLAQGDIDAVFHLAAETSVFNDRLDDIERENIHAFIAVATACHRHGVKLVYASSSTANACNTTSMYGMSKRFNEQFAKAYCPSATGVRLHNVYGREPRQGTLLYNLLHGPCTIYNGGRNVRHFTYIGDAAEAVREFCDEVAKYRDLNLDYTDELRPLDNFAQSVDEGIYCVPLHYRDIRQGLALTLSE